MDKFFTTIGGLKRVAKKLQRETGIPYHEALNRASQIGGFHNFSDAHRHLDNRHRETQFDISIREGWRDRETREHGTGSVSVGLSAPLNELLKPHHLAGYLGGSRIESDIELLGWSRSDGAERAKLETARMARTLQFMDITGWKPSNSKRCYPKGQWENRPPIADHDNCWYDPATKQHILSTEPYPGRYDSNADKQRDWAKDHDYSTVKVRWGSIYGLGTELYLAAKNGKALSLRVTASRLENSVPALQEDAVKIKVVITRSRALA